MTALFPTIATWSALLIAAAFLDCSSCKHAANPTNNRDPRLQTFRQSSANLPSPSQTGTPSTNVQVHAHSVQLYSDQATWRTEGDCRGEWNQTDRTYCQINVAEWLQEHAVESDKLIGDICYGVELCGVPRVPCVVCADLVEPPWIKDGSLLYEGRIWALRDRHLELVFESPLASGPSDPMSNNSRYEVKLELHVSDSGDALTLVDSLDHSCNSASSKLKQLSKGRDEWRRQAQKLYNQVCRARGKYIWTAGRYARIGSAHSRSFSGP